MLWIDPEDLSDTPGVAETSAVEMASYVLYKLTGKKFPGYQTTTEWYCNTYTDYSIALASMYRVMPAHLVQSIIPDAPVDKLLTLRGRPVIDVTEARGSSGGLIDTHIIDAQSLMRADGLPWNLSTGVLITYKYGQNPPLAGKLAAVELARQLSMLFQDETDECQLNPRVMGSVSSINSQGIAYNMVDPQTFLTEGRTGITAVDLFIKSANPSGALSPARILTQEDYRGYRRR